jgi:hypothetical protein
LSIHHAQVIRIDLIGDASMRQIAHIIGSERLLPVAHTAAVDALFSVQDFSNGAFEVEVFPAQASEALHEAWQELADNGLDDNPFLSPSFMIPASMHLIGDAMLSLVAVWHQQKDIRKLVGLFPLAAVRWQLTNAWRGSNMARFWSHPMQPFCTPLLAGPTELAENTIRIFMDWLEFRRPKLTSLEAQFFPVNSNASLLLQQEIKTRGLTLTSRRDAANTRGLDFRPVRMLPQVDNISVVRGRAEVRLALEKLFCLDAVASAQQEGGKAILNNPQYIAFLRATLRSFSLQDKVTIALIDEPQAKGGAIVLEGRDKCYLWWLMGEHSADPMVEATLAAAVERAIGKTIVAATQRPMAGLWTEALLTESLSIALRRR